jgi:hypothetical protein
MVVLRVETARRAAKPRSARVKALEIGRSLYGDVGGVRQSLEKAGGQLPQFQRALTERFGKELILKPKWSEARAAPFGTILA